jgi:hypothetical protein
MEQPKLQTISFFGTVAGGSNLTLVSQKIGERFKTKIIRASFAPGVNRLMTLKFFISQDPSAPTTEEPQGINILKQIGQVPYITGDDEYKELPHETLYPERNAYIKVYAENSDTYEHTIDAQVTIEYIEDDDNSEA